MDNYSEPLAWSRLILDRLSPVTGLGTHSAPSLLYPMEALFEAFVAKHVRTQLASSHGLTVQHGSKYLVRHSGRNMFKLRPDLIVHEGGQVRLVLDTKWKLLDQFKSSGTDKYNLDQSDFYQLHAYGHAHLGGDGDLILIYPMTPTFTRPLEVFTFTGSPDLRLWVAPFCLLSKRVMLPDHSDDGERVSRAFRSATA